jgi:hypothetical protein
MNSVEQPKKKILLIDGLSTIMNEKYFILDEIPRILADYIEEGFTIWIVLRLREDASRWYEPKVVPDWLRDNCIVFSDFDFSNVSKIADQETSMVITNNLENPVLYDICGTVNHINEIFHFGTFPIVNKADYILCFGFNELKFTEFVKQSNLIGIIGDHVARDNDPGNTVNGMAFLVDKNENSPSNIISLEESWIKSYKDITDYINLCVKEKRYKPKHGNSILGAIYQGKDITQAKLSGLNLLYV